MFSEIQKTCFPFLCLDCHSCPPWHVLSFCPIAVNGLQIKMYILLEHHLRMLLQLPVCSLSQFFLLSLWHSLVNSGALYFLAQLGQGNCLSSNVPSIRPAARKGRGCCPWEQGIQRCSGEQQDPSCSCTVFLSLDQHCSLSYEQRDWK